jgi:ankyrin repeat protein
MLAARYGHIRVVKYLLDLDADLSLHNTQNLTAIDFALMNNQKEIADGLISRWKKLYGTDYVIKVK